MCTNKLHIVYPLVLLIDISGCPTTHMIRIQTIKKNWLLYDSVHHEGCRPFCIYMHNFVMFSGNYSWKYVN